MPNIKDQIVDGNGPINEPIAIADVKQVIFLIDVRSVFNNV